MKIAHESEKPVEDTKHLSYQKMCIFSSSTSAENLVSIGSTTTNKKKSDFFIYFIKKIDSLSPRLPYTIQNIIKYFYRSIIHTSFKRSIKSVFESFRTCES